ncbi:hypothetical protein FRC07_005132 [Ceratobasidium sp. 392]|nr:hypothetical protein FRC07_005132 [Ceratobasidium sp. 392]
MIFRIHSWSTIAQEAQRAPLLPNLQELTFRGKFTYEDEIALWVSALTPPSLKVLDICASGDLSLLSPNNVAMILGLLPQKCPQLQKLSHKLSLVLGTPEESKQFPEQSAVQQLILPQLVRNHLQNSQCLTSLAIGGCFIAPETIVALSRLPSLHDIDIDQVLCPNENLCETFQECSLGPKSFPMLQELRFSSRDLDDFLAIRQAAPLVSSLTSVQLKHDLSGEYVVSSIYAKDTLDLLLRAIAKGSRRMKKIALDGRPTNVTLSNWSIAFTPWASMKCLPLTHVKLHNFKADSNFLQKVFWVWPNLLVLDLSSQEVTLA